MNIIKVLESSGVMRFHSVPGVTMQSIAEHSWGVALLCQKFMPYCSKDLILTALTHDCAELMTGDVPAPAKWKSHNLKSELDGMEMEVDSKWGIVFDLADYREHVLLKICDALEGMNYCLSRREHGEVGASAPFQAWSNHLLKTFDLSEEQKSFHKILIFRMEKLTNGR